MRRLLVAFTLLVSAVVTGFLQQSPAEAASIPVIAYLYHPVGDYTYSSVLTCGWHDVCDGVYTDSSKKGLDWVWPGAASYDVWVRMRIYGGSGDYVVSAQAYNATFGCKRIWFDMYGSTSGQYIGAVTNQHAQAPGLYYYNLRTSGSGFYNNMFVGSMVPYGQDNCTSSGPHAMQWYTNSSASGVTKNTVGLPYESGCVLCYRSYGHWTTYEYLFTFWS